MRIAVSPETFAQSEYWTLPAGIEFVPMSVDMRTPPLAAIRALWRRQPDRTTWLRAVLDALPELRWLHTDTVGIDRLPLEVLTARGVVVSNARGVYARAMAEFAIAVILMIAKRLGEVYDAQRSARWVSLAPRKVGGATLMMLGGGAVAQALIPRCVALGMRAVCVNRTGRWSGPLKQAGVRLFTADGAWRSELSSVDYLIVALPLTPATRQMVDLGVLRQLRDGAAVINVGRAETIDRTALIDALRSGRLGSAWLDVHEQEPLPAADPLWSEPRVFISPHISAVSHENELACRALFFQQLAAVLAGRQPECAVDLARGY